MQENTARRSFKNAVHRQLRKPLFANLAIFFGILLSFYFSSFFTFEPMGFFVLSFVNAFMVAAMLLLGLRILPAIIAALFAHQLLFVDVPIVHVLLFATTLPIPPIITTLAYSNAVKRVKAHSVLLKVGIYFLLFGMLLPVLQALLLTLVASLSGIFLGAEFILLSSVSMSLTHLIITPPLFVFLSVLFWSGKDKYIALDKNIFRMNSSPWAYRVWLAMLAMFIVVKLLLPDSLMLYSLGFVSMVMVFIGIGRFGILRPMLIGSVVVSIIVYSATTQVNAAMALDDEYVALMEILTAFAILAYIHGSSSIRSFLMSNEKIRVERTDPYTGLYNLSQLKEDMVHCEQPILVFFDLWPTLTKLAGIGHSGQAQLLRQITRELFAARSDIKRAYRPPFTTGVLFFLPQKEDIQGELVTLSLMLDEFQFYWQGTSISLVSHTLHCWTLTNDEDLDAKISVFCDQPYLANQKICWFDDNQLSGQRVSRLITVQHALKNNEFELFCQPYRNLQDPSAANSFEVLLRLRPADGSSLEPEEFFPMINEFGVEAKLDRWVIENTFKQLSTHLTQWNLINRCAINLTAKSLGDEDLSAYVLSLAKIYQIPLDRICFEITESAALENEAQAITTVEALKEAGCNIALDDFGTGYASFSYLRRIPVTVLKIDGEFIRHLPTNPTDKLIVQSISLVAKNMSLVTVAEYVETEEHATLLKELGINYAQGFGMAKPIPLVQHIGAMNALAQT
ncbi:EAL domain-containing protein [Enterovibrio norvegicus FF-33]|uniref:sensor domain-containing phosphodiesterase n=1 Tax=Enterovibrio norvegicus TaxID=188144 RepID=UPI000314D0AB|nr:EAL domain-containing protein [Enterovibrio norvegicus]OEE66653.1 EAL domain-containing protein [Enterovibrio norvegicus FF-33]